MIRRILLLISFFLCLSFPVHAENWKEIKTIPDGTATYYLDTDRLEVEGDSATVWTKLETTKGHTVLSQMKFHRKPRTFDVLYFHFSAQDGKPPMEQTVDRKGEPIAPGSVTEAAYRFIWPASTENWVYLRDSSENKNFKIYADANSIDQNGNTATVWVKIVGMDGYGLYKLEYQKEDRTAAVLYYQFYHKEKLIAAGPVARTPKYIKPRSDEEAAYNYIWPKAS